MASVSGVPYTGTSKSRRRYDSAPMWSSWPWVRTTPRKRRAAIAEIREVGDHVVHPGHLVVREQEPAVDGDHVVARLDQHHVEPDLAQPPSGIRRTAGADGTSIGTGAGR